MKTVGIFVAFSAALVAASVAARQNPPTQTPVFRTGVDLVRLDVSVLDKDRQPVRGLTQADFTVFEGGKPQPIEAFSIVDLPDRVETTTEWKRTVDADVVTNDLAGHRLIAIVIDDSEFVLSPVTMKNAKQIARTVIDRMGPQDLATVVFTRDNRNTQNFTSSHARLVTSIEKTTIGHPDDPNYSQWMLKTIGSVAEYLIAAPEQRKVLVYISSGMPWDLLAAQMPQRGSARGGMQEREAILALGPARERLFQEAEKANVNVYAYDVCGLRPAAPPPGAPVPDPCALTEKGRISVDWLQTVSNNTGGHATINTNDFGPGITQMFRENSSYYLLAYRPSHPDNDGSVRRIEVKVNRPGVTARTRSRVESDTEASAAKAAAGSADVKALAAILPKADLPLRLVAAAFAVPGKQTATVTLALGLRQPAQTQRMTDEVRVLVKAFTPEGAERESADQTIAITVPPARRGSEFTRYEALTRMDLKPGRYELRVSTHSSAFDLQGSVYADVDVPDFAKAPLSMSGVVLGATPGLAAAPADALGAIVPVSPTAEREFARIDRVAAFLRVYQGSKNRLAPVKLTTRIVDGHGANALENSETLGVDRFPTARAAESRFTLPLAQLSPGEYLLTFEAALDKTTARRDVRFKVR
jgi:VWFA-related protein